MQSATRINRKLLRFTNTQRRSEDGYRPRSNLVYYSFASICEWQKVAVISRVINARCAVRRHCLLTNHNAAWRH